MKYTVILSTRFKKDFKLAQKRGKDMEKLRYVISVLADGGKLDERYHDHTLKGKYDGYQECHIEPDWLLIYRYVDDELLLYLTRTGTHSDLLDM